MKDIIGFTNSPDRASDAIGLTPDDIVAFTVRRWHRGHYVVSLARYLFEAHRLSERLSSGETKRAEAWNPAQRAGYRLADNVSFLSFIHDAPRILEALSTQNESEFAGGTRTRLGERVSGLLVRCDPANPSEAHTWKVNGPTSILLRRLKRARPARELLADVSRRGGHVGEARRLLNDLVDRGFVERGVAV